jgi:hypothetical protein
LWPSTPPPVLIVEGEKDVVTATGLGILAVTNADGGGKWRAEDTQTLATGRYTSTDPNQQNIPTDSEFRGFFRAPEGRVFVDVDYSQLELRVFAALSKDAKMIQAFEDGWDYHNLVVERVGCTRRQAKAINFGIIFGKGVASLAVDLGEIARKQELVMALEAHIATLDPALTSKCIASGKQLDQLFRKRLESYPGNVQRPALLAWPKTDKKRWLSFAREDLAKVIVAGRLQSAEQKLVEALYTRAQEASGLTTFGTAFSEHVVDGRLYGQLHAGGAVTGRYTSTDPNQQNIPTDSEFRGFFRPPEGRVFVDVDYSQLELRVFAALSKDAKMIQAFEDGWDHHNLVAERVGCTRRQAKAINFGIIFGKGVASLAVDLGVDDMTAGEYLRAW